MTQLHIYEIETPDDSAIQSLLEWVYTGSFTCDLIACWAVLKTAKDFKVSGLQTCTENWIRDSLKKFVFNN